MFNRYEEFKYVIENKLMDNGVIKLMLDMHLQLGTLKEEEYNLLYGLMHPEKVSPTVQ